MAYDSAKILPGLDQPHTEVYRVLRAGLFHFEQAGGTVEELQPPIGAISTIESMVQQFQNEANTSNLGGNSLLEVEVDISDESGDDEAQNHGGSDEFGDDGLFFEP